MSHTALPPRLAERLLARVLPSRTQQHGVIGDLREEYARRRAHSTRVMSDLWFWRQAIVGYWRFRSEYRRAAPAVRQGGAAHLVSDLLADLRFAFRTLRKRPGFTGTAVLSLALGIGATTATFTLVNSVLLTSLPFEGGNRLVKIWQEGEQMGAMVSVTPAREMVEAWREGASSFDAIMTYQEEQLLFLGGDEPQRLDVGEVSSNMLSQLGVPALIGRVFSLRDGTPEGADVALLSEGYWRSRFGSDPEILGRSLTLGDTPRVVVGVLPATAVRALEVGLFDGAAKAVWTPLREAVTPAGEGSPFVLARLRPGVVRADAQRDLDQIQSQLVQAGIMEAGWRPAVLAPSDTVSWQLRTGLLVVFGAVGFVLLIACVNIANMLLARGIAREREFAIRSAIGASRLRVFRQLFIESLLLSLLGGVLGALVAYWGVDAVVALASDDLQELRNAHIEPVVLGFTLALSLATALVFGLAPALQLRSVNATGALTHGHPTGWLAPGRSTVRQVLVSVEVVVALVLVVGAGLMVNSLVRLQEVNPGFDPDGLVTINVTLPETRYPDDLHRTVFYEDVASRVARLPRVESVAWATGVPPRLPVLFGTVEIGRSGSETEMGVASSGEGYLSDASPLITANWVSLDYFRTIGMRLLEGRTFIDRDKHDAARPIVVNRALARRYWSEGEAVGKQIRLTSPYRSVDWSTIVGVVDDVKAFWLGDDADRGQMYFPFNEVRRDRGVVVVRTDSEPADMIPLLREQVWAVDPDLPVDGVAIVTSELSDSIARPRFNALVLTSLAVLALTLAGIGVYGVVTLSVSQRTREIGVRVALGARRGEILKLMVASGMKPILIGGVVGVAASLVLTRFLRSLLFEVHPTDPVTYVVVTVLLTGVGAFACYVPSRRATGVDPVEVLRYD